MKVKGSSPLRLRKVIKVKTVATISSLSGVCVEIFLNSDKTVVCVLLVATMGREKVYQK